MDKNPYFHQTIRLMTMSCITAAMIMAGCGNGRRPETNLAGGTPAVSTSTGASGVAVAKPEIKTDTPAGEIAGKIVFLHHSTGEVIWNGGVSEWFDAYNSGHGTTYQITEQAFPKDTPYGWENYPYDYWNIWVNHAGQEPYKEEPTLEMLTRQYEVIVFKHCFPVSDIDANSGTPDVASKDKTLENYQAQYQALKEKMRRFPATKFIVWTGSAQVRRATSPEQAERARAFARWVRDVWDEKGDNIFVWDFRELETGGDLYLLDHNAAGRDNSHPSHALAGRVAPLFCQRVVNVIQGHGDD